MAGDIPFTSVTGRGVNYSLGIPLFHTFCGQRFPQLWLASPLLCTPCGIFMSNTGIGRIFYMKQAGVLFNDGNLRWNLVWNEVFSAVSAGRTCHSHQRFLAFKCDEGSQKRTWCLRASRCHHPPLWLLRSWGWVRWGRIGIIHHTCHPRDAQELRM